MGSSERYTFMFKNQFFKNMENLRYEGRVVGDFVYDVSRFHWKTHVAREDDRRLRDSSEMSKLSETG